MIISIFLVSGSPKRQGYKVDCSGTGKGCRVPQPLTNKPPLNGDITDFLVKSKYMFCTKQRDVCFVFILFIFYCRQLGCCAIYIYTVYIYTVYIYIYNKLLYIYIYIQWCLFTKLITTTGTLQKTFFHLQMHEHTMQSYLFKKKTISNSYNN